GSALSSVVSEEGLAAMFNGTSMAAPLFSGSLASILSGLREESFSPYLNFLEKRNQNSIEDSEQEVSLLGFTELVKSAVEQGSTLIPQASVLDQGYGLFQAEAVENQLKEFLNKHFTGENSGFPEIIVNNNSEEERLYNRDEERVS